MKRACKSPQQELSLIFRLRKEIDFLSECQGQAEQTYLMLKAERDLLQMKLGEAEKENARLRKLIYRAE